MATVNQSKLFKAFLPKTVRYRGKVLEVDAELSRVRVEYGASSEWASTALSLAVNEHVLVENGQALRKLPELPYAAVSVY